MAGTFFEGDAVRRTSRLRSSQGTLGCQGFATYLYVFGPNDGRQDDKNYGENQCSSVSKWSWLLKLAIQFELLSLFFPLEDFVSDCQAWAHHILEQRLAQMKTA